VPRQHGPAATADATDAERLQLLNRLGIAAWADRSDWFQADDHQVVALQSAAKASQHEIRRCFGFSAGSRAIRTLRYLLRAAGLDLDADRLPGDSGRWSYRVQQPAAAAPPAMESDSDPWLPILTAEALTTADLGRAALVHVPVTGWHLAPLGPPADGGYTHFIRLHGLPVLLP
jgi:hypothetical protein